MTRYLAQTRDRIFVKGYEFLSFAKNMGKIIGKNISKNLSGKYSQKLLDHAKQSATDALKTASKRVFQKTAKPIGDLIGNSIADKITEFSKCSQQNYSETVANEHDKEKSRERYIPPEETQKIIYDLKLI